MRRPAMLIGMLFLVLAVALEGAAEAVSVATKYLTADACPYPGEQDYFCLLAQGCISGDGAIDPLCAKTKASKLICSCSNKMVSTEILVPVPSPGGVGLDDAIARIGIAAAWAVRGTASIEYSVDGGKTFVHLTKVSTSTLTASSFSSFATSYRAAIVNGRSKGASSFRFIASGEPR